MLTSILDFQKCQTPDLVENDEKINFDYNFQNSHEIEYELEF